MRSRRGVKLEIVHKNDQCWGLGLSLSLSQKGSDPLEASRFSNLLTRLAGEGQTPFGIGSYHKCHCW
jgi:hypothetical protein